MCSVLMLVSSTMNCACSNMFIALVLPVLVDPISLAGIRLHGANSIILKMVCIPTHTCIHC